MGTGQVPQVRPQYLYKYRALGGHEPLTKAIVTTSKIWFSRPSHFNDPFDCNLHVPWRLTGAQLATRMLDRLWPSETAGKPMDPPPAEDAVRREGQPARPEAKLSWATIGRALFRGLLEEGIAVKATWTDRKGHTTDLAEHASEQRERRALEVKAKLDEALGVLSLSASPDHQLLWSHYADDHRGICLEFDVERCASTFARLQPVRYAVAAPSISEGFPALVEKLLALGGKERRELVLDAAYAVARASRRERRSPEEEAVLASVVADLDGWFYTKSKVWEYEEEWRSLAGAEGAVLFPREALTAIVVGCVETEATIEKVRGWLAERGAPVALRRARKKEGQFALEILPVS